MPELPEVETVVRQLVPLLVGKTVSAVSVIDHKLKGGADVPLTTRKMKGRVVAGVNRVGKQISIELVSSTTPHNTLWLVCHLRMTGRLIYADTVSSMPNKHLRARISFGRGELQFIDVRRFGTLGLYDDPAKFAAPGLDPTTSAFTVAKFKSLLGNSKQDMKAWLMRQDKLCGIGNIYACEALYAAGIAPIRLAGSLDAVEAITLHRAVKRILKSAIKNCGTTISDFQDSRGEIGSYQRFLKVYGRAGQPCKTCGNPIARMVQQQRSTFYCGTCQK